LGANGNATDICPVRNRALLFAPTCTTPASGAPLFTQALTEFHTNSEGINNINKQTKQKTGGFKVSALCALHCDNNATGAKLRVDSSTTPRVRTVASVTVRAAAPPEGSGGVRLARAVCFKPEKTSLNQNKWAKRAGAHLYRGCARKLTPLYPRS